jgi:hypothetical protein
MFLCFNCIQDVTCPDHNSRNITILLHSSLNFLQSIAIVREYHRDYTKQVQKFLGTVFSTLNIHGILIYVKDSN